MMWLKSIEVKEVPEEVAGRETESMLKVCDEDNYFALEWFQHDLAGGKPTLHSLGDALSLHEPVYLRQDYVEPLPGRTS
jgi:hypothetical protein